MIKNWLIASIAAKPVDQIKASSSFPSVRRRRWKLRLCWQFLTFKPSSMSLAPLSALPPHGSSAKEALRITSQLEVDVKIYNSDRLDHTHSPLSPLPRCVHVSPQRHQLRRRHVTADRHHPDVRRWGLGARTARTWARPIREPHVTAVRPMRGEKACSPVARWSVSHFWAKLREASPSLSAPTTTGILITSRHYHRSREQQQQYHIMFYKSLPQIIIQSINLSTSKGCTFPILIYCIWCGLFAKCCFRFTYVDFDQGLFCPF